MSLLQLIKICFFISSVFASLQLPSNVTLLTDTNFYRLVSNDNVWVIHFYARTTKTSKHQSFGKEFALGADILKGIIKFGSVDVEKNVELAENFAVSKKSLPVVKVYGVSSDGRVRDYNGPKTARDLVESVLMSVLEKVRKQFGKKLPENLVEEVNDSNFDKIITRSKEPWMVLFYAPWCVHCTEFKPIWASAAASLQKKIKCASIDATTNNNKAREYQIREYPTVKLFPFEKKSPKHTFQYTQERTVEGLTNWVLRMLPGPKVVELTNVAVFQKHCTQQDLCVISVVPSLFDCQVGCRKNYLDVLKSLSEKMKKERWGWIWTEAGAQARLERALEIGGSGYPALVALNPTKMKYSVFKGPFTKSGIEEFLKKLAKVKAVGVEGDIIGKIVAVRAWEEKYYVNESKSMESGYKDEL